MLVSNPARSINQRDKMKLSKMSSIEQYRNIVKTMIHQSQFMGLDDNGEPIYDKLQPKPKTEFTGTVKLHGTNASVGCDHEGNLWFQSKKNIITPLDDNCGFAQFAESKKELFRSIFEKYPLEDNQILIIYGEWAGKGIQSGVAISEIDKAFYVFSAKLQTLDENNEVTETYYLSECELNTLVENDNCNRLFNLHMFRKYLVSVDCAEPHKAQNVMVKIVEEIEKECPIASVLGISGIGEGIVFVGEYNGNRYAFKVKGEKHAGKSKIKKLNVVDDGKINLVNDTVNKVLPVWRLDQFFNEVVGEDINRKKLGDYIRAVLADIVKEELDILTESGLSVKDIGKTVSDQARNYFFQREKL